MSSAAANSIGCVPGSVLADRYQLIRELGRGGMGHVYLARHIALGHHVAIKVLHATTGLPMATQRFLREARQTARLRHPNVVEVTDLGETDDGLPFLVMEYLDGEDLAQLMDREGPLCWERVCGILLQLCEGLTVAHAEGLVHRDLKPENCFLVRDRTGRHVVKILDFGIAKSLRSEHTRLTRTGGILGTPEYMSPEQARGRALDPRSDVYALGVLAYEMLSGVPPFSGDDYMGVLLQHINDPVPPLPEAVPVPVSAMVFRALAKDPSQRFESVGAMAEALRDSPQHPPPASWMPLDPSWPPLASGEATLVSSNAARGQTLEAVAYEAVPPTRRSNRWGAWFAVGTFAALAGAAVAFWPGVEQDAVTPRSEPATEARPASRQAPPESPSPSEAAAVLAPQPQPAAAEPAASAESAASVDGGASPEAGTNDDLAEGMDRADRSERRRSPLSRRQIAASLRRVKPLTAACIGGLTGGQRGDRVRVRLIVSGSTGEVRSAAAVGSHANTALGGCVADAARRAAFPTFGRRSARVTWVFEL